MRREDGIKSSILENSLAAQWLRLCAFTAEDPGLIPGWETRVLQATRPKKKKKKNSTLSSVTSCVMLYDLLIF